MQYLIAEIGNNHEGDPARAKSLIDIAARSGADAVKFQIFRADRLVHPSLPAMVGEGTQLERMRALEFDHATWQGLEAHAKERGVDFLATCFDPELVDRWRHLRYIKIASGDLTYPDLLRAAAATGQPIILSTGGATMAEVESAIQGLNKDRLILLHCVTEYPTADNRADLGRIGALRRVHRRVGYSDHTCGITACLAAGALGAEMIEKHFTDKRRDYGDHRHSATPDELQVLAGHLRRVSEMLLEPLTVPRQDRRAMQRGPYASKPLPAGYEIKREDVLALRPRTGHGLESVIGCKIAHAVKALEAL